MIESAAASLAITDAPAEVASDADHIQGLIAVMRAEEQFILGFPGNLEFDYSEFGGLLGIFLNNVGDPTSQDSSDVHTKAYEREVIRFLAHVANADPLDIYGYVTSSGSEGNLFGMHRGRRRLPGAPIYCSEDAHYSVRKAADLLAHELVEVPTLPDGALDPTALERACRARSHRDAIVVATVGTTMRGAIDDVVAAREAATAAGDVHLHVDAASGGLVAAFAPSRPLWGFDAGADSITISGHKVIGMPVPCSVALARSELVAAGQAGEYTGATDSTLSGSRSGLAALLLWFALRRRGRDGMRAELRGALEVAEYAQQRLAELGYRASRHPASLTVVFDRPAPEVCTKWHLATERDKAHIVTVPHVTVDAIDAFCLDLCTGA